MESRPSSNVFPWEMAFLPDRPNRRKANDAYQMCHPDRDGW